MIELILKIFFMQLKNPGKIVSFLQLRQLREREREIGSNKNTGYIFENFFLKVEEKEKSQKKIFFQREDMCDLFLYSILFAQIFTGLNLIFLYFHSFIHLFSIKFIIIIIQKKNSYFKNQLRNFILNENFL